MDLRIMTFNLRFKNDRDGINCWDNRRPLVKQVLDDLNPDIIGFQEVVDSQLSDLVALLPDYAYVGDGRADPSEQGSGERAPIFYRRTLVVGASGTFWLSRTPDVPSKHWGALHRVCTWLEVGNPPRWLMANTHLDYRPEAFQPSAEVLSKQLSEKSKGLPVVVVGDFNFGATNKAYKILRGHWRDAYLEDPANRSDNLLTFHNFRGWRSHLLTRGGRFRIDHIWIGGREVAVRMARINVWDSTTSGGIYPSDHYQVFADLRVPE